MEHVQTAHNVKEISPDVAEKACAAFHDIDWQEGARQMFEQLDDPKLAGRKSWKERLSEGAVILVVVAVVIGILVYVLISK